MSDFHNEIYRKKTGGNQKVADSRGGGSTQIPQANQIAYGNTNVESALDDNTGAIEAIVNVTGSKNLNSYPYLETTKTENGITYTDNGDGTVTVGVGTASADSSFVCHRWDDAITYPTGINYILSGCPEGGSDNSFRIRTGFFDGSSSPLGEISTTGSETEYTLPSNAVTAFLAIDIASGTVITEPITFKPMIRDARITDPTYVPFAMTNRQLTESVAELKSNITANTVRINEDLSSYSTSNPYVFPSDGYVACGDEASPSGAARAVIMDSNGYNIGVIYIEANGTFQGGCTFVRKGMRAYTQLLTSQNGYVYFKGL